MSSKIHEYFDGNNNHYILDFEKKLTIEYIPVKPINSSSGIYNGGEYVKKEINKDLYDHIISSLHNLIRKKEIHIKDRIKMSEMIIIEKKGKRKQYILDPYSAEKVNIEKELKKLIEI